MIRTITRPLAVLGAASLAPALLLAATGTAHAAAAAATSGKSDNGLFGAADPTYDGAYRQSLALLAFSAAGVDAPKDSVDWLVKQQCKDGGWEAYRADTSVACTASNSTAFSGPDTNSTAVALEALGAIGADITGDPTAFLKSAQNADGGFGYYVGSTSDPNSTALVMQAILSDGQDPASADWTKNGKNGYDYLQAQQVLTCTTAGEFGGIQSPFSGGHPDTFASLQAIPAMAGKAFPLAGVPTLGAAPANPCPNAPASLTRAAAATNAAAWLSRQINSDGTLNGFDGKPSVSNTAYGVLALSAAGVGDDSKRQAAANWLLNTGVPATADPKTDNPGELGLIVQANVAAGPAAGPKKANVASLSQITAILNRIAATARVVATPTPTPTSTPTPEPSATPVDVTGSGTTTSAGGTLPMTGANDTETILMLGLASLAIGGGLVNVSRRVARAKA